MPSDGSPVIVAYRWRPKGELRVAIGCWFMRGTTPGVIEYPDGCYLPCVGWLPMPSGEHPEHLPLHIRDMEEFAA
jgi:hypothetical protein